jgi:DNA mismatch repair protein MutS
MVLMYDQYKNFYNKHEYYGKYAVLLQIGGFYELYGKDNNIDTNASEIASKLSIEFVLKDKVKGQKMAGIPIYKYDKYKNILLKLGYTIIKIEQVPDNFICSPDVLFSGSSGKLEKRAITEIVSPGTNTDNENIQNNIVSLHLDKTGSASIAVIDVSISSVIHVYESHAGQNRGLERDGGNKVIDDMTRLLCLYPGSEYIVTRPRSVSDKEILSVLSVLNVPSDYHSVFTDQIKVTTENVSPLLSWCVNSLKQFLNNRLYDTNSLTIEYMELDYLELSYNCAKQLELGLLYKLLDKCSTPMGSRLLYTRLFKPMKDPKKIQESLDAIEKTDTKEASEYSKLFKNLCDFDKIIQGLQISGVTHAKFKHFYDNLVLLKDTADTVGFNTKLNDIIVQLINFIDKKLVYLPDTTMYLGNTELDTLYFKRDNYMKTQEEFIKDIKYILQKHTKIKTTATIDIKIKDNSITLSNARALAVKKECPGWIYITKSNETLVSSPEFTQVCMYKADNNAEISKLEKMLFIELQYQLYNTFKDSLQDLTQCIGLLDFYQSAVNIRENHKLSRPTITVNKKLSLKGLRHLLVEEYNQETEYITNDLEFNNETLGSVVYGCNSSGKSCLLKGTGLAVIMAQAGLYIPCESMEFSPLECIMTRIIGGDDIKNGKSSFIIELEEISSILHRTNDKTLVLIDEASKGSETESASAINYGLVKFLISRESFFLSTTHLHNLSGDFSEISKINVYNMRIIIDKGNIIFERKLQKGSGIPLYGLEVAKILKFPKEFMDIAFAYRNKNTPIPVSKSLYNSKSIKVSCELCGYYPKTNTDLRLDTHHLKFQCNAINDYNGVYHKNRLSNLVTLCKGCHVNVHAKNIQIKSVQTLNGIIHVSSSKEINETP